MGSFKCKKKKKKDIVTSYIHSQFKECLWDGYNNTGHNKIMHMNITLLF